MADALLTGLSALTTQQRAMEVTAHNIANATTPGYSRQRVDISAATPEDIHPGQLGRGVTLDSITRMADDLLTVRLRAVEGESGRLATLKDNLTIVQQAFNEPGNNGLSAMIGNTFNALQDLTNNPEAVAIRATAVQQLTTFTSSLSDLGQQLDSLSADLRVSIDANLKTVNQLSSSIASLNQQIRDQVLRGNHPNDLLDQRDQQLQELTGLIDCRVRTDPNDQSVQVEVGGRLLVGATAADQLRVVTGDGGRQNVIGSSGLGVDIAGGTVGALLELHGSLIPQVSGDLDTLTRNLARELNRQHAVATSNSFFANSWTSGQAIDTTLSTANLDDPRQVRARAGDPGIIQGSLPDFTDGKGNLQAKNLTINVVDTTTRLARKYTVHFNPSLNNGQRSLDDLIHAINTGAGGAFSLYPPGSNGIPGINARKVQVDSGGYRLELAATDPKASIDFATALDLKPTASAWHSGTMTVTSTAAAVPAALRGSRAAIEITGPTTARVTARDPNNGQVAVLGTFDPTVGGTVAGLTIGPVAGPVTGDQIALSFDGLGNVIDPVTGAAGSATVAQSWIAGDASMTISGRYTNTLSDVSRPWSVKVLTAGVIGNKQTQTPPNNPPVVQFTVWTGTPDAPVQQVITRTLDDSLPAGTPIQLADGVYASFTAGSLTSAASTASFTVDGQPDQAGILTALGINQLLVDADAASSVGMAKRITGDPSQLAIAATRNEGDNSQLAKMIDVRKENLYRNSSFALDDFYQGILTDVGVRIQQATRLGDNQDALKASLTHQREQVSGVNIDEEVGGLILQQQAYSAAARVVTTTRDNIQTLMDIIR